VKYSVPYFLFQYFFDKPTLRNSFSLSHLTQIIAIGLLYRWEVTVMRETTGGGLLVPDSTGLYIPPPIASLI
jgi:hypothetical protein